MADNKERKAFNFFKSYFDVFEALITDKDKLAFISALLNKQFYGIEPTGLKGMANFAYISQKYNIDSQVKGYEDKTGVKLTPTIGGIDGGLSTPTQQEKEKEKEKEKEEVKVKEEYSDEIKNFTHSILKHFPIQPKKIEEWYKVTDQLINLDKYNYDSILLIVERFTKDEFWAKNFQSYTKLRKKNKDQIKYVDYFKNTLIAEKNGKSKRDNKEGCTWDELAEVLKKHEIKEE